MKNQGKINIFFLFWIFIMILLIIWVVNLLWNNIQIVISDQWFVVIFLFVIMSFSLSIFFVFLIIIDLLRINEQIKK
jgi:hypothetical protein